MLLIFVGLLMLVGGAEFFVRGSVQIATRAGLSPLVIGLTLVAFGTSAPELMVSVSASLQGSGDVALGNIIGSNLFNIAVILGITAMLSPPRVELSLLRREIPLLAVLSVLISVLLSLNLVSRPVGMILLTGLVVYTISTVRGARREAFDFPDGSSVGELVVNRPVWMAGVISLLGLLALVFGSRFFVSGAMVLARDLGVSEAVIGLTVVAMGTSLPELATSIVAAFRGQSGVAIGNVVGSNFFNLLGILGVTVVIRPLASINLSWLDLGFMTGAALMLIPFAISGRRLSRFEGAILISAYAVYLFLIWPT